MMGRGGVKTFDALVDAVGDNSSVDGKAHAPVVAPRSGFVPVGAATRPGRQPVQPPRFVRRPCKSWPRSLSSNCSRWSSSAGRTFQNIYPEANISARWVVIIGNRRLAAAQKFGRPELDIVVKDELARDRATLLTAVISENVDRSGFDVIEEAKAVESLVGEYGSADAAADHLRKSKTWVSHRRALLKLAPDLQEATRRGDLAIREARSLARVPLEQQVARWSAARDRHRPRDDANSEPGEGSAESVPRDESAAPHGRSVTRALRKFDTEPNALAVALRDHLGETGARTLVESVEEAAEVASEGASFPRKTGPCSHHSAESHARSARAEFVWASTAFGAPPHPARRRGGLTIRVADRGRRWASVAAGCRPSPPLALRTRFTGGTVTEARVGVAQSDHRGG